MATLTASEARARLPEILDRVSRGEEITITRHDVPVAVVLAPGALRHRRASAVAAIQDAHELGRRLESLRDRPLSDMPGISSERAEELVRELRVERDAD